MTVSPLRFGLIGTGRIGKVHAHSIFVDPDTELSWVADPFVDGAVRVGARYGAKVSDSAAEVIASGEIDALLIASPTPTHIELIEAAIDAGIPVLCEKPIDLDIDRVNALRAKVHASGVPVALGFNRRFDASFASARSRVNSGEIGHLEQLLIISRDQSAPPEPYIAVSGGIFRDMTIHDFDMARFFVPDIVEVSAVGTGMFDEGAREHGDFDTAVAVLRSASGTIVSITNSRHCAFGYDQRIEAFGSTGMLHVANPGRSLVSLSSELGVETKETYLDNFLERYAGAYTAELQEFIKLVRGEPSTSPTFEDGRAALMLADAAQLSATEHIVVPVDLS